ncbi:hypothetical protein AMJ52_07955 [candidate division TA06 bacterium DG_78]|uniref:Uncharacterized protein n=1 Tax=candidate division TA06 bacterium DG_78 TaxID=1703772 RepID=A0A0S7YAX1_UNCT6|nr:MAG: hypothetical protein AMJ52_07955 [candidate division TA06 bacterium DG_78]
MPKRRKTYIRQLDHDDGDKALEFELQFQSTLATAERFKMMFEIYDRIKKILIRNGHIKPVEIVQLDS